MSPRLRNLLLTSTALLALGTVLGGIVPGSAQPTGGTVVGGSATISGSGTNSVIVNQSTDRAIINWNTFNISTGGSATFNQPGTSSITLNRVTGGLGPSVIDGTLTANGRVFIINRDGMLFGKNAVINTAGFLASTNDIRNDDFMAGRMNFNIPGRGDASIVNLGTITASSGGFAALVAPGVRNSGTISAQLGTVSLASGNSFTLDMYGDRLIQVAVGDEIAGKVIDVATGKPLSSLVTNDGTLRANGGRVEITAAAARHIVDSVINNRGVIEANSVGTRAGKIVLGGATATAGLPKQTVKISGKLSATGKDKGSTGGTIQITGEDIQFAAAMLDVSGHSGGGKILVGGDYGGGKPIPGAVNNQSAVLEGSAIPTAATVTVDGATTFNASATANGHGGKVILWSDVLTTFAGTIFARGGELGGNGGFVEVSGKQQLAFTGSVDTRAPNGRTGTLLLDPADFYIIAPGDPAPPSGASVMTNVQVQTLLNSSEVVIQTANHLNPPDQGGDIFVNAPITVSNHNSQSTLTLYAYRDIFINADITGGGSSNVHLRADVYGTGVGTVKFAAGAMISGMQNVNIFYNPASYNDAATKSDLSGNPYLANVIGATYFNAYMLVNTAQDLQDIRDNLTGKYALGRDINATDFSFTPLATFHGLLEGQFRTITGLATTGAAPFTAVDGEIRNLNLVNVSVSANGHQQTIGGLVGTLSGGTLNNVSVSGTVNGGAFVDIVAGGLVGNNQGGQISNSHAAVNVTIGTSSDVCNIEICSFQRSAHAGGLVGINNGHISGASASGTVTGGGGAIIGGLVGSNGLSIENGGSIWNSYASGAVSSSVGSSEYFAAHAGGLVGANWGSIESSYATGKVSSSGNVRIASVGGLVGQLMGVGTIETSYASGNVSVENIYAGAEGSSAGGLVGATQSNTWIHDSYALGNVTASGATSNYMLWVGGLIGSHEGSVQRAYSTGAVAAGSGNVATLVAGGFIGNRIVESHVAYGYWDTQTSGLTSEHAVGAGSSGGITGLSTKNARTLSSYAGFDFRAFEGTWFMVDGQTRPFLQMEHSTTIRNAHQLQLIAMNLGANYTLANNIDFTGQFGASGMWGATGFAPIGWAGSPFTGSLNGQGFTINALMIAPNNATLQSVGMFHTIGAGGVVSNLNFTNALVKANPGFVQPDVEIPVSQWVGILAGESGGTITNVTATGTVDGLSVTGVVAGGLVGQHGILGNDGPSTYTPGSITNSWANVNVTVGDGDACPGSCMFNAAGGLVGVNVGGSSISNSHAEGNVSGGARTWAGGLVGQNGFFWPAGAVGTIMNSYATGKVTASGEQSAAGGLVGSNTWASTITGSHASGTVNGSGGATAGGLAGENYGNITASYAEGTVTLTLTDETDAMAGGFVGNNTGTISNSYATGAVSSTNGDVTLGGFAGFNAGNISGSHASGAVTATNATLAMLGGFVGGNAGDITTSHATGHVSTNAALAFAGGFAGVNFGQIGLSYAKGNVSVGENSFAGGFVGFNAGEINQAYAIGAVTGAANSFLGGFVGVNFGADFGDAAQLASVSEFEPINSGSITQSYALGPVTGGNAAVAAAFAALNLGSLDQVYGVGRVQGGAGSTLGGLVASNNLNLSLPPDFNLPEGQLPAGTATNSYWDFQTTAMTTSAGGTGMNTAVLAGGLPAGFDPVIWSHGSYPFLVNIIPNDQNTNPLPPVIPPVGGGDNSNPDNLPPVDQQINSNPLNLATPPTDPLPDTTLFVQQQQQQQQRQQQSSALTTGSLGPQPIRLDVGENRYFYLPPPGETRLVADEVVLQMPCDVPQPVLDAILKQHTLTMLASQCLQEGGQAAFRLRHASNQTVSAVIRALAQHQIIAAAQANYLYALQETSVQSATSQQGDPGQYVPEKLRLFSVHRVVTGANIPIGVIDSEIDAAHPDLSGAIANRYDATGVEDRPHAHGTGMAGAIVSRQKLLGVAPGARILAIRAFSTRASNAESTTFHILKGLDWAVANNVRIVNMSFAGPRDPSLERALKAAFDKGVILIAAAGNAGPRAPALYPAADPHVIAVTATDIDDRLFGGANRGNHVAIAAPGVDILVPAPAGEYQVTTGTSVATAHISGVVALMLERNPKLTPTDVLKILAGSAKRLGPQNQFGAGLVDPVRAIEMATPRSAAAPSSPVRQTTTAAPRSTATAAVRP